MDYQGLVVALPEAESLIRKRDEAQAWARQAQKVLSQPLSESLTHEYEVGCTPAAVWVCIIYACLCLMTQAHRLTCLVCGRKWWWKAGRQACRWTSWPRSRTAWRLWSG